MAETDQVAVELAESSPSMRLHATPCFEDVYRRYFRYVWAALLRLGVPEAAVEDALQDVFVVVHRQLPSFEGRSPVRVWLYGIARRIASRHRRGAQRVDRKHRALAREQRASMMLDDSVEHGQLRALLFDALEELDDDKREALTLHVFEDRSGPEVAEILNIKVDTAYSRIKAARKTLHRSLLRAGLHRDADALRRATRPPKGMRRRVAGGVAAKLGLVGAPSAVGVAASWKAIAFALALGAVAVVAVKAPTSGAQEPAATPAGPHEPIVAAAPKPTDAPPIPRRQPAEVDVTPVPEPEPEPTHEPEAGPGHRPATSKAEPPPKTDALTREVALITRAKGALDAGHAQHALALLAEHGKQFGDGQLRAEHAAYRAIALCDSGRSKQGRGEATLFLRQSPESTLAGRVSEACGIARKKP